MKFVFRSTFPFAPEPKACIHSRKVRDTDNDSAMGTQRPLRSKHER
jgi:hypothetical protein